eukprot:gene3187-2169_t
MRNIKTYLTHHAKKPSNTPNQHRKPKQNKIISSTKITNYQPIHCINSYSNYTYRKPNILHTNPNHISRFKRQTDCIKPIYFVKTHTEVTTIKRTQHLQDHQNLKPYKQIKPPTTPTIRPVNKNLIIQALPKLSPIFNIRRNSMDSNALTWQQTWKVNKPPQIPRTTTSTKLSKSVILPHPKSNTVITNQALNTQLLPRCHSNCEACNNHPTRKSRNKACTIQIQHLRILQPNHIEHPQQTSKQKYVSHPPSSRHTSTTGITNVHKATHSIIHNGATPNTRQPMEYTQLTHRKLQEPKQFHAQQIRKQNPKFYDMPTQLPIGSHPHSPKPAQISPQTKLCRNAIPTGSSYSTVPNLTKQHHQTGKPGRSKTHKPNKQLPKQSKSCMLHGSITTNHCRQYLNPTLNYGQQQYTTHTKTNLSTQIRQYSSSRLTTLKGVTHNTHNFTSTRTRNPDPTTQFHHNLCPQNNLKFCGTYPPRSHSWLQHSCCVVGTFQESKYHSTQQTSPPSSTVANVIQNASLEYTVDATPAKFHHPNHQNHIVANLRHKADLQVPYVDSPRNHRDPELSLQPQNNSKFCGTHPPILLPSNHNIPTASQAPFQKPKYHSTQQITHNTTQNFHSNPKHQAGNTVYPPITNLRLPCNLHPKQALLNQKSNPQCAHGTKPQKSIENKSTVHPNLVRNHKTTKIPQIQSALCLCNNRCIRVVTQALASVKYHNNQQSPHTTKHTHRKLTKSSRLEIYCRPTIVPNSRQHGSNPQIDPLNHKSNSQSYQPIYPTPKAPYRYIISASRCQNSRYTNKPRKLCRNTCPKFSTMEAQNASSVPRIQPVDMKSIIITGLNSVLANSQLQINDTATQTRKTSKHKLSLGRKPTVK